MSLKGLRVLNTRPQGQAALLSLAIENAGGHAIELPTLAIEALTTNWLSQLPDLATVDQTIFISTNAVNYFFTALQKIQLLWPPNILVTAVGQSSAAALNTWGISCQFPIIADSEHLLELESLQKVQEQNIMIIKGEGGRIKITQTLLARGAKVTPIAVYRRTLPLINRSYLHSLWHDNAVDIILITSEQALRHLFVLFGEDARQWLCSKPCLVISERLAQAARILGINRIMVSDYDNILSALEHYTRKKYS